MREKKEKKSGLKRARRASERSDEDGEDGGRPDAAVDGAGARPRQPVGTAVAVHSAAARDRAEAADEPAAAEVDAAAEESDSDDDGVRNTIGDVPIEWYDDYDHIGYTLDGKRFARPPQRDELDALIERYDKGSARTVYDALHGEYVTLTDDDVNLIRRIQAGQYPDPHFDPFPAPVELAPVQTEPMWSRPAPKSRFLPSKWERKRVVRLVRAMRSEAYQKSIAAQRAQKEAQRPDYNYAIWDETLEDLTREQRRMHKRLLAPKLPPPTNAESYNPPAEYLFTPEEEEEWRNTDPSDRTLGFVPRKFDSLRRVPAYEQLASERFQRCLDLYLCPRTQRTRLQIEPDSLLPQLPDLSQLEPYPKRLTTTYRGHEGRVRTLSVHPAGEWLASGGDDGTVRLWEVATGRCVGEWALARAADAADVDAGAADAPDAIHRVAFAPDSARYLLAVSVGSRVLLLSAAGLAPARAGMDAAADDAAVGEAPAAAGPSVLAWRHESVPTPRLRVGRAGANGQGAAGGGTTHALCIPHAKPARVLAWHPRCDYLATVVPEGGAKAVLLSQVSRRVTQQPFGKSKGRVESVLFHPSKPHLFVATQRQVRLYDLVKQQLIKKLSVGVQWVSTMALHPGGDNLLVGSYDKRVAWFDLDLSTTPYKTLRPHTLAVRAVAFHPTLPLFASSSDDLGVQVYHGQVFNDLDSNAMLVPLKRIEAHQSSASGLGALDCAFHPHQPWLFSCGADGTVRLYT